MALPSRRFLKPRNSQIRGRAVGRTASVPAPIGGLNAVDSIAAMNPEDAIILDNFFPQPTFVQLRSGTSEWSTGLPSYVETLMGYSDETSTESLFAISGTSVYDASAAGPIGAAVVTGLSNARWESVNVSTPGGAFLYAANGSDKPLLYDGSSWVSVDSGSTPAITGITTTELRNPAVWKSRVWFVENHSTRAWYLPVQQVGGGATSLDLATIWNLGGELQVILTFSLSSATSFDDYIGFLSSEGQLAVYQGTDPDDAASFSIVGVYNMGKPVGRRCWFKYGNDAVIICSDGLVSVQRVISVGIKNPKDAVSYKIQQLINADIQNYSSNFGWQGVVFPLGNKVIINVPRATNTSSHQYVMNSINSAWCSYGLMNSPWNASCFCVLGDKLYWGGSTIIYQADVGRNDSSAQIFGSMLPAYSYFGTNRQKRFTMLRPILLTSGPVTPALGLSLDFQTKLPTGTPTFSPQAGGIWGTGKWGVAVWGSSPSQVQKYWQTIYGIGFSASAYMQIAATQAEVKVLSFDWTLEDGGIL